MADGLSRLALGRLRLRAEGRQDAFGGSLALASADSVRYGPQTSCQASHLRQAEVLDLHRDGEGRVDPYCAGRPMPDDLASWRRSAMS
jgi:hypothetical protein